MPRCLLNTCRNGYSTTSLGSLFHCLTILLVKMGNGGLVCNSSSRFSPAPSWVLSTSFIPSGKHCSSMGSPAGCSKDPCSTVALHGQQGDNPYPHGLHLLVSHARTKTQHRGADSSTTDTQGEGRRHYVQCFRLAWF